MFKKLKIVMAAALVVSFPQLGYSQVVAVAPVAPVAPVVQVVGFGLRFGLIDCCGR